jgi:hypothetical protein
MITDNLKSLCFILSMVSINQVAPPGALHCKPAAEY